MRTTVVDDAVLKVAKRQHGAFSRAQAFAAGASERFIERRLAGRDWLKVDTGVYVLPSSSGTWERQLWIALLGARQAAVAGLSAAVVHDIPEFRPGRPEILIPPGVTTRSKVAVVHKFSGAKLTTVKGFPVTTLAQTLCDLSMLCDPWRLERSIDDSLLRHRLRIDDLVERLLFYAGGHRHGTVLFRGLVQERMDDAYVPPESELEGVAAELFAPIPGLRLQRQLRIEWRPGIESRLDFVDVDRRLIIEIDGRRWHARTQAFDADRWRDNEAVAHGWRALRFTYVHLVHAPAVVVELVRRTIGLPPLAV